MNKDTNTPPIVHIANYPQHGTQQCARCGYVLIDDREGQEIEARNGSGWWVVGAYVKVTFEQHQYGNMTRFSSRSCSVVTVDEYIACACAAAR